MYKIQIIADVAKYICQQTFDSLGYRQQPTENKYIATAICTNKIIGTPMRNLLCWVLWRKRVMAINAAGAPPNTASHSSTASGMRQRPWRDFHLSRP